MGKFSMTFYQVCCTECNYLSGIVVTYEGVFLDDPIDSIHAHPDCPQIAILAHPAEPHILQELGLTLESVHREGRLITHSPVICEECGHLFETRHITASTPIILGCLPSLVVVLVLAVIITFSTGHPLFGLLSALIVFMLVANIFNWPIAAWLRRRHQTRKKLIEQANCPRCESKEYARVNLLALPRSFPCPQCSKKSAKIKLWRTPDD